MIARDVGVRGGRAGGLRRLLGWARSPDDGRALVERSVLRLEHYPGAPPLFGMFFGAAAIEQGIRFCLDPQSTRSGVSGELGAGLTLAALLGRAGARPGRHGDIRCPITTAARRRDARAS